MLLCHRRLERQLALTAIRDRIGPGRMADHVGASFGIDRHVADRESLAELQQAAIGDQVARLGLPQKIEVEARGNRERHGTDMGENRRIEGKVRQRHHGRARDGAAGTQVTLVVLHPQPGGEWPNLINEIAAPSRMHLRELTVEERRQLVPGHDGMVG